MDTVKLQIAMKFGISPHDIFDYYIDICNAGSTYARLKFNVCGEYNGMDAKFHKIKHLAQTDQSVTSVVANTMDQSPIISITIQTELFVGDKFTLLLFRALTKQYKVAHGQYKSLIKQRCNATAKRLAERPR